MFASNAIQRRETISGLLLKITFIILIRIVGKIIGNRITETIQFSSKLYIYQFRDSFNWQFCFTTNLIEVSLYEESTYPSVQLLELTITNQ